MADGFDLDAMLDSALDEGFGEAAAETATKTASAPAPEPVLVPVAGADELDLDSMLDDALGVSSVSTDGAATAPQGIKASSNFGASEEWLQRKQGRQEEPWPFLSAERREVWKAALEEDARRQADMDRQRPFSRAYRSFYPTRDDGGIVVHLGSGAVAAAGDSVEAKDSAELGGEGGGGGDPGGVSDEGRRGAEELFEEVFSKGVSMSGVNEPPLVEEEDYKVFDRLKVSYLRLVAKDIRARLKNDPDLDAARFPGISSKILV